jgi:hypothetical protein
MDDRTHQNDAPLKDDEARTEEAKQAADEYAEALREMLRKLCKLPKLFK